MDSTNNERLAEEANARYEDILAQLKANTAKWKSQILDLTSDTK